jgi:UDP-glucose 4-epimerase
MTWLVTGAAGYIGAHVVARLHAAGQRTVALDDLSSGVAGRLPAGVPLIRADVSDIAVVRAAMACHGVTGVMHLAGVKSAPESTLRPMHYYRQNVGAVAALLEAMTDFGVRRLVFSSSAAVYGIPGTATVTEQSPTRPVNPYGQSKLAAEDLIAAAGRAYDISWTALRYFNAVGAGGPQLGDRGAANLIPLAFRAVQCGEPLIVAGDRWPTPDGTGVRDYVHVSDLADVHCLVARQLERSGGATVYNVGAGRGYSVREVLAAVSLVTGRAVPHRIGPPRPGDPPEVVACIDKLRAELGWRPRHDLLDAVTSAWNARPQPVTPTACATPVMNAASSLLRTATKAATSAVEATRPVGFGAGSSAGAPTSLR